MVNMNQDKVTKLGFMSTYVDVRGLRSTRDYLWMIIQEDTQLENQPGKFALYSFRD